jgi:hypothetical protein
VSSWRGPRPRSMGATVGKPNRLVGIKTIHNTGRGQNRNSLENNSKAQKKNSQPEKRRDEGLAKARRTRTQRSLAAGRRRARPRPWPPAAAAAAERRAPALALAGCPGRAGTRRRRSRRGRRAGGQPRGRYAAGGGARAAGRPHRGAPCHEPSQGCWANRAASLQQSMRRAGATKAGGGRCGALAARSLRRSRAGRSLQRVGRCKGRGVRKLSQWVVRSS